jgi:hypothetical protein
VFYFPLIVLTLLAGLREEVEDFSDLTLADDLTLLATDASEMTDF